MEPGTELTMGSLFGCDAIFHCRTSFYIAVIVISFCSGACAAV